MHVKGWFAWMVDHPKEICNFHYSADIKTSGIFTNLKQHVQGWFETEEHLGVVVKQTEKEPDSGNGCFREDPKWTR